MEASFVTRHRRTLISAGIVLVIALHIVPMLYPSEQFWPIMQWSMYKESKAPGPIFTHTRKLFATTRSGHTEAITPNYTGVSSFVLDRDYIRPMMRGDRDAPARLLVKLNSQRSEDPFVEVRLEQSKFTLTDSGIVRTNYPNINYRREASDSL